MKKIALAVSIVTTGLLVTAGIANAGDSTVLRSTGASMSNNALESSNYKMYHEADVDSGTNKSFTSSRPRRALIWAQCTDDSGGQHVVRLYLPDTGGMSLCKAQSINYGNRVHTSSIVSLHGSQAHNFTVHADRGGSSAKVYLYE